MPRITNEYRSAWTVTGSPERLLDRAPDGTLWFQQNSGDHVYYWFSNDEGNTWSFSGSEADYLDSFFVRAFHVDSNGILHSVGRVGNVSLKYFRGKPRERAYGWGHGWRDRHCFWDLDYDGLRFNGANEALAPDGGLDVVAFQWGQGFRVFVLFTTTTRSGGVYTNTLRLAQINVSRWGQDYVQAVSVIRTSTGDSVPYGCLTFKHTGDGKTPSATPHVYVVSSVNTQNTASYRQDDLLLHKFTYEAGNYTQGSSVLIESAVDTTNRTMRATYDGQRVVVVYGTTSRAAGIGSSAIHEADWDEPSGVVTRHDPPAYGGGYPIGVSSAVDPAADDIYVIAHGSTSATPVWSRYSRASSAWSAWTTFGTSLAGWSRTGRVTMKQYVQKSAIEAVYATGANPWAVTYVKLTVTNVAPSVPALLAPAPSSVADLGNQGAVFQWQFVDPDPGDVQGGWQMRRRVGAGAYSYYIASTQTWGSTATWNTGADQQVSFPPGVWTNGSIWSWSVNTRDSAGLPSGFAPDISVTASTSPTVVVTAPVGIYAIDSAPVVAWDYNSANPQRTYQIRVFPLAVYSAAGFDPVAGTPVWDSGDVPSVQARATRIGVSLLNGGTYRAFMRVSDANGLYSAWSYGEFLLSLSPGPTPTVQAVVETDYASGLGRVRLTIQGLANYLSANQAYDHADNTQWEATNCAIGNSPNGVVAQTLLSMKLTATAAGNMSARTYPGIAPLDTTGATTPTPRDFPAKTGQTYTAAASFTANDTPRNVRVTMTWWGPPLIDGDPDLLKATTTGTFLADIIGYPALATATGVCPLGADRVRLTVEVLGAAAGEVHYVDAISLHPGTSTDYSPGGLTAQQVFTATRTLPDGTVSTLRTVDQASGDKFQRLIAYDREMPFGTPVEYSVQSVIQLTSGQVLASNPSLGAQVEVDSDVWAIRDPVDLLGEARALVTSHEVQRDSLTSIYRPAGRSLPLVESQGSTGDDASKMSVWVSTVADRHVMRNILNRQTELIVQSPNGDSWYVWVTQQKPTADAGQGQNIDVTYVQVDMP